MSARSEIIGKMPPAYSIHDRAVVIMDAAERVIDQKNEELAAVKAELEKLARGSNVVERLRDWARNQRMFEPDKIAADSILSALLERAQEAIRPGVKAEWEEFDTAAGIKRTKVAGGWLYCTAVPSEWQVRLGSTTPVNIVFVPFAR